MTKLTTVLPTVLLATFAPALVVATDTFFTSYENDNCTGDAVGTFPATNGDKRYLEVKFKATPTDLTACNKASFRAGTSSTKDHWVMMTCPTGGNMQVNISAYRGNTGSCTSEDNQMGYYMVNASEVTKLKAGNCAKVDHTLTWGASNTVYPSRSVKITGFAATASVVCSLCGNTCSDGTGNIAGNNASNGNGSATTTKKVGTASAAYSPLKTLTTHVVLLIGAAKML